MLKRFLNLYIGLALTLLTIQCGREAPNSNDTGVAKAQSQAKSESDTSFHSNKLDIYSDTCDSDPSFVPSIEVWAQQLDPDGVYFKSLSFYIVGNPKLGEPYLLDESPQEFPDGVTLAAQFYDVSQNSAPGLESGTVTFQSFSSEDGGGIQLEVDLTFEDGFQFKGPLSGNLKVNPGAACSE